MNDNYSVIYSPEALDDIRKIYSYIAFELQVPDTALNQVNRIRKEIRSLNLMPMRYSIVDWEPWKSMQIHKVPVDNYVIYYLVDSNIYTVTVIRIVYGGQDIENNIK
ncbi:MAG: type II toxin-antitoxin system RelE/ParE family toxin [Clostridiales bacterium]|nr:type II toxin-antitoxin system RelE/ParE family toxin [Clostridiales bacterium]